MEYAQKSSLASQYEQRYFRMFCYLGFKKFYSYY